MAQSSIQPVTNIDSKCFIESDWHTTGLFCPVECEGRFEDHIIKLSGLICLFNNYYQIAFTNMKKTQREVIRIKQWNAHKKKKDLEHTSCIDYFICSSSLSKPQLNLMKHCINFECMKLIAFLSHYFGIHVWFYRHYWYLFLTLKNILCTLELLLIR